MRKRYKLTIEESSVTWRIVVMLSPNVLPQSPQNFAEEFPIDGLALGVEFSITIQWMLKEKKDGHAVT